MEFEIYVDYLSGEYPELAKSINDKQPSGFYNIDQWILKSIENNLIPNN
jgi:hypothetical protein